MGDFSRATHLSVKTLRHYHQVGLLEPVTVNPDTGYRYYSAGQIPTAQVIRRLRDLAMPVADVKAVLAAPDAPARNAYATTHEISIDGPLREYYLLGVDHTSDEAEWRTEIGWPIFRADAPRT